MGKKKEKFINSKQAVRLAKKFNIMATREHILKKFRNGDFLFRRKNIETGIITDYFLNEIYFKKFLKNYSVCSERRNGKELLISNFELPRGKVTNI